MSLPHSHPFSSNSRSPILTTQVLKIIERCFEDCKLQINNRLAGIGQPTKGEEKFTMAVLHLCRVA